MSPRGMFGPRPLFDLPPFPFPFPLAGGDVLPFGGVRDLLRFGVAAAFGWAGLSVAALRGNGRRWNVTEG